MTKLITFLIFNLSVFALAQNINSIRKQVSAINASKNYFIKTIPNNYFTDSKNEVTDNGQELEGFYTKKELKKIVHSVGLSSQKITTQFYFNKMDLIFVLRKKYQTIDNEGQYIAPKLIAEYRFYFVDGKIVSKIGKNDKTEVAEIKQQSMNFQNDLKIYK